MSRRKARELALKVLYQMEMGGVEQEAALQFVFNEFDILGKDQEYSRELVQGTVEQRSLIDEVIGKVSREWNIDRMATVDRNILRLGLWEILFKDDVPNTVAINEAIELGKEFSTADSGKFINGILGKVAKNADEYTNAKPGV